MGTFLSKTPVNLPVKLSTGQAKNLLNAADGLKKITEGNSDPWAGIQPYPERHADPNGIAFTEDLNITAVSKKDSINGIVDAHEAFLALQQLRWDSGNRTTDETVNPDPIQDQDVLESAQSLLSQLFNLDKLNTTNGDNVVRDNLHFTIDDVDALSMLDGNGDDISQTDLDILNRQDGDNQWMKQSDLNTLG